MVDLCNIIYRDGIVTFLSIEHNGEYVADVDRSFILRGSIGVLIGEVPTSRYKRYYRYNKVSEKN